MAIIGRTLSLLARNGCAYPVPDYPCVHDRHAVADWWWTLLGEFAVAKLHGMALVGKYAAIGSAGGVGFCGEKSIPHQ